jgi:MoaA/NifB/PqqE/SkfB family radical SAM enzyme
MKDRERLWNYYTAGRLYLPRPRYLCVNATLRCDGRCRHCGIWRQVRSERELSPSELRAVLKHPFFSRVETAWLTGGEPTLREDLGELAAVMVAALPALTTLGLATNGLEPSRTLERVRDMAAAATDRHLIFAHVSLDGVGEAHDLVRGRPGAFAAVLETLERLGEARAALTGPRLALGLNCVIQPGNVSGLEALRHWAQERGLTIMFNLALVTDQVYRNQDRAAELMLSPKERREVSAFLGRIMDESPPAFRYQYRLIQAVLADQPRPGRGRSL